MSPVASPGLCLDVSNAVFVNTAVVQLWTCNQTPAQQWQFWSDDTLRPASNPSFCLDAKTGVPTWSAFTGASPPSPLQLYSCVGNNWDRQLWSFQHVQGGAPTEVAVNNCASSRNNYAILYAPSYSSGTGVQSANVADGTIQTWNLTPANTSPSSTGASGGSTGSGNTQSASICTTKYACSTATMSAHHTSCGAPFDCVDQWACCLDGQMTCSSIMAIHLPAHALQLSSVPSSQRGPRATGVRVRLPHAGLLARRPDPWNVGMRMGPLQSLPTAIRT